MLFFAEYQRLWCFINMPYTSNLTINSSLKIDYSAQKSGCLVNLGVSIFILLNIYTNFAELCVRMRRRMMHTRAHIRTIKITQ